MTQRTEVVAQHRSKAWETSDGFVLDGGEGRLPVRITLQPTHWLMEFEGGPERELAPPRRFGLFEIHPLVTCATSWSLIPWRPRTGPAPEWRLRGWALQQARRSVGWVVRQQRQRLMYRVKPVVREVQRALFAACCSAGELALHEAFYREADRFLIADVLRYRAAAIAVRNFGERLLEDEIESEGPNLDPTCYDRKSFVGRACSRLCGWRDLFSDTRHSYGPLNRTLDRLPGGLSHHLVCLLPETHLQREVVDRLELAVLLLGLERQQHPHQRVFQFARRHEILGGLAAGRQYPTLGNVFSPPARPTPVRPLPNRLSGNALWQHRRTGRALHPLAQRPCPPSG